MTPPPAMVGIAGAGAWGSALASMVVRAGHRALLWGRDSGLLAEIAATGINPAYLPGQALGGIETTTDLAGLARADPILLAVPARACPDLAARLLPLLPATTRILLCAKGIDPATGDPVGASLARLLARPVAVLSGPSFARDVAAGLPTAVVIAATDPALAADLAALLGGATFRPYAADDPIGVELGGVVKNVLAIGCGIAIGRGLGENARAALITRGLAELARLGAALGARAETLMGLAGLGDLTLTCTSLTSRNFAFGVALGAGRPLPPRPEGAHSAAGIAALAARRGVEMPIVAAVDAVLNRQADLDQAIAGLMRRPLRSENGAPFRSEND